jgi:hypothetical protein
MIPRADPVNKLHRIGSKMYIIERNVIDTMNPLNRRRGVPSAPMERTILLIVSDAPMIVISVAPVAKFFYCVN